MPPFLRAGCTIAAVALAASTPIGAQGYFTGGMKGGAGQFSYTGKHEFAWKMTGPDLGAFLNWETGTPFTPQLEIGQSHRLGVSTSGGSKLTFTATTIDVSLLAKYRFGFVLGLRPFVLAGPTMMYSGSCNLQFITAGLPTSNTPCIDSTVRRLDFGFSGAVGLSHAVGWSTFSLEARGSTSFRASVAPLETTASRTLAWSVLGAISVPLQIRIARRAPGVPPGVASADAPIDPIGGGSATLGARPAAPPDLSGLAGAGASGKKISVTAVDTDARSLLLAIAQEAGISMVVSRDVNRPVSVALKDVSPDEAIRAIIAAAGLSIVEPPSSHALPAVVFYQLPVNVSDASAETIATRFGVSADLAKWIAESRSAMPALRPDKP